MARAAECSQVTCGQVLRSGVLLGPVVTFLCFIMATELADAAGAGEGQFAGCPMRWMQGILEHVHPPSLETRP